MKKIKAFTILELVIVMVITTFIVVAGYFAYSSSARRLDIFKSLSEGNVDLTQLNFLLKKDFEQCVWASLTTPQKLTLKVNDAEELIYVFEGNFIYRKSLTHSDTFNIHVRKVTGKELDQNRFYLAGLSVSLESGEKDISLDYFKSYDPYFLMNLTDK